MAVYEHIDATDNGPVYHKTNADKEILVSTGFSVTPTYNEINVVHNLAEIAIDSDDLVIGSDGAGGRQLTIAVQNAVPVTGAASATAGTHMALVDSGASKVMLLWPITPITVLNGQTVNFAEEARYYRVLTLVA